MAETIDKTISKLFCKAYNNDELFEYLIGKGEYLNNKLIDFMNSNDTLKVTTALDFFFYYAGYAPKLQF